MFAFDWKFAVAGNLFSIILSWIVDRSGKEFNDKTLGKFTKWMTAMNYVRSRRDRGFVNKNEIEHKLAILLKESLALDRLPKKNDLLIEQ